MIEAGIDGLQSLQPDARDMAPERLKRLYGRDIVLNGCLDTHHLLIAGHARPRPARDAGASWRS